MVIIHRRHLAVSFIHNLLCLVSLSVADFRLKFPSTWCDTATDAHEKNKQTKNRLVALSRQPSISAQSVDILARIQLLP